MFCLNKLIWYRGTSKSGSGADCEKFFKHPPSNNSSFQVSLWKGIRTSLLVAYFVPFSRLLLEFVCQKYQGRGERGGQRKKINTSVFLGSELLWEESQKSKWRRGSVLKPTESKKFLLSIATSDAPWHSIKTPSS